MKRLSVLLIAIALSAFQTNKSTPPDKITLVLTPQETEMVYYSLGKLPAEQSESVRAKIAIQYNAQMTDTTKQSPSKTKQK